MKRLFALLVLGASVLAIPACGDSAPTCGSVASRICQIACNCSEDACVVDLGGSEFSGTQPSCNQALTPACESAGYDTTACNDSLNGVMCSDIGGQMGLVLPAACR